MLPKIVYFVKENASRIIFYFCSKSRAIPRK